MTQQTPEKTIEVLQSSIKDFKVRTFDLQETLQSERQSFTQFVGVVGQLIGIEDAEAQNLQAYVDKLAVITGHSVAPAEADADAEEAAE